MNHIINRQASYNPVSGICSYNPWYLAKGLWGGKLVSEEMLEGIGVPSYLGVAYERLEMAAVVMYPKPLHLVARLIRNYYWGFLRIFYWVGFIDTGVGEAFRWADFFRIKVH